MTKKKKQNSKSFLIILSIIILLALIIFFLFRWINFFGKQFFSFDKKTNSQPLATMIDMRPDFPFILNDNDQPLTKIELDQEATREASQAAKTRQIIVDDLVEYVDGELLVQFKERVKLADLRALGVEPEISIFDNLALLSITDQESVKEKIMVLKKTDWFDSVEPNYVYELNSQNESGR